jgi:hypothetical protein
VKRVFTAERCKYDEFKMEMKLLEDSQVFGGCI